MTTEPTRPEIDDRLQTRPGQPLETRGVVIMTTSLAAGGAEKQAVLLANHLSETGPVKVFTMFGGTFREGQLSGAVDLIALGFTRPISSVRNLGAFLSTRKLLGSTAGDTTITFNYPAQLLVTALQLSGVKLRHIVSERQTHLGPPWRVCLRRLTFRKAAAITANTHATAQSLELKGLIDAQEVVITPNFVEGSPRLPQVRARNPFRWICVARLHPQKGLFHLLDAMARISRGPLRAELWIVGDGPMRGELSRRIAKMGLDNVRLLGIRDDLPQLLAQCDALVLPSLWEGVPNTVLEAAIGGIPVVASDLPGVREAMGSSANRWTAPPGASRMLAERMEQLMLLSDEERIQVAHELQGHVLVEFSSDVALGTWGRLVATDTK